MLHRFERALESLALLHLHRRFELSVSCSATLFAITNAFRAFLKVGLKHYI